MRFIGRLRTPALALAALALSAGIWLVMVAAGTRLADDIGILVYASAAAVLAFLVLAAVAGSARRRVRSGTVLEVDLGDPVTDATDPLSQLSGGGRRLGLRDVVQALERAASDGRVAGAVAWIRTPAKGLADVQELREAVLAFRRSGKFAVAWAESFGELSGSTAAFYLATAFDEVHLQPSGDVGFTGVALESNFVKGTLGKIDAVAHMDHRHEYKSAKNRLTETGFTDPDREQMGRIADSWFEQLVQGVAEGRRMSAEDVRALVDRAPVLGADAVGVGLVDRLSYRDEVVDAVKARAGGPLLRLDRYRQRARKPAGRGRPVTVALVQGTGAISQGRSRFDPLSGTQGMGSDTVSDAIRRAAADRKVKAILFRVDSPGGSAVASDAIRRAVVKARQDGTPVIVSMGNVAGSGGYYVSTDADRIVAHPGTITGSIGVVGGKIELTGTKARLGVTVDEVHVGAHAGIWSANRGYSDSEWERVQALLDRIYDDFTAKVASGRNLPLERVGEVAKGRVWTGADALERGLVDTLGGYATALGLARELIGVEADRSVRLVPYPRKGLLSRLRGGRDDSSDPSAALAGVLADVADVAGELAPLLAPRPAGALTMPFVPRLR